MQLHDFLPELRTGSVKNVSLVKLVVHFCNPRPFHLMRNEADVKAMLQEAVATYSKEQGLLLESYKDLITKLCSGGHIDFTRASSYHDDLFAAIGMEVHVVQSDDTGASTVTARSTGKPFPWEADPSILSAIPEKLRAEITMFTARVQTYRKCSRGYTIAFSEYV